jgi:hypothetical protein
MALTTKIHLAITPDGQVVEVLLSGGNAHDMTMAKDLVADVFGCHVLADTS